jgi:hypothetical protein
MKRRELPAVGDLMREGSLVHQWAYTDLDGGWFGWCHAQRLSNRPWIEDRADDEEGITCLICLVLSHSCI